MKLLDMMKDDSPELVLTGADKDDFAAVMAKLWDDSPIVVQKINEATALRGVRRPDGSRDWFYEGAA